MTVVVSVRTREWDCNCTAAAGSCWVVVRGRLGSSMLSIQFEEVDQRTTGNDYWYTPASFTIISQEGFMFMFQKNDAGVEVQYNQRSLLSSSSSQPSKTQQDETTIRNRTTSNNAVSLDSNSNRNGSITSSSSQLFKEAAAAGSSPWQC